MGCSEADWLRWLPAAVEGGRLRMAPGSATLAVDRGLLILAWSPLPPRSLGLFKLPRLSVAFRFEGVDAAEREAFMRRFDVHTQRGGG